MARTWSVLVLFSVMTMFCGCAKQSRNLVLVVVDGLHPDGISGEVTPNIDSITRQGVVFGRALATAPERTPAFASLLTGKYPTRHGLFSRELAPLAPGVETMAGMLRAGGYNTVALSAAFPLHIVLGLDGGFDDVLDEVLQNPTVAPSELNQTLNAWLERRSSSTPLFLCIVYRFPDSPEVADSDQATTSSPIELIDQAIGELTGILGNHGLFDSSVMSVVGLPGPKREALGSPLLPQDELHMFWTLRPPPNSPDRGRRINAPVSLVDVLPTCVAAATGAAHLESDVDGVNAWRTDPHGHRVVYAVSLVDSLHRRDVEMRPEFVVAAVTQTAKIVGTPSTNVFYTLDNEWQELPQTPIWTDEYRLLLRQLSDWRSACARSLSELPTPPWWNRLEGYHPKYWEDSPD